MINNAINIQRKFIIGSEWLYYNIYIGPQTSDKFLLSILQPFTDQLISKNIIDKWFFIRYKDKDGLHLRVRFHLNKVEQLNTIILEFQSLILPLIQEKLISNITVNTYNRELERYGFDTIEEFEALFFINSKLIINLIKLSDNSLENRWLLGMKAIDIFLNSWNFSLEQKKQLLETLKTGFGVEFGIDKNIKSQLSKKYRDNKHKIENILNESNQELDTVLQNFLQESTLYIKIILKKLNTQNHNNPSVVNDYLGSYLHMHCNRLFQSKQRKHEWILYDLLFQYYYSTFARNKKT